MSDQILKLSSLRYNIESLIGFRSLKIVTSLNLNLPSIVWVVNLNNGKNRITFASKAARDNCICHGEIARKKAESWAIDSFSNNFLASKYVTITVNTPKNAEGNRIANSVRSKIAIE